MDSEGKVESVIYRCEVTRTDTGAKETYTGLTDGTMRDRIGKHGQCAKPKPGWHQVLDACAEAGRQGLPLHCHLADPCQGEQLQPHHRHVPTLFKGEVFYHVCTCNGLPEHEVRDLQRLQAQGKQAVETMLDFFTLPFPFLLLLVRKVDCF